MLAAVLVLYLTGVVRYTRTTTPVQLNDMPLHKAISDGRPLSEIVGLLDANPSLVKSRDFHGFTPMHVAARSNRPRVIALLASRGANVDARRRLLTSGRVTRMKKTPLMDAAAEGHSDAVDALLEAGADPRLTTEKPDYTAADFAEFMGHPKVAHRIADAIRESTSNVNGAVSK